jgi:hypothetical protein
VFTSWFEQNKSQAASTAGSQGRKASVAGQQGADEGTGNTATAGDGAAARFATTEKKPTEVILRGYRSPAQQYAAINHYEQLAGRICEDYPRDPPPGARRYKSELRDPAFTRPRRLTAAERALVNRADGGEHWVKVTFESAEAAEAALFASPQSVAGFLVYADPYTGAGPGVDEAVPEREEAGFGRPSSRGATFGNRRSLRNRGNGAGANGNGNGKTPFDLSPPHSQASSRTADTATVSAVSTATTSGTLTGPSTPRPVNRQVAPSTPRNQKDPDSPDGNNLYCRTIPSAKKARILPAEAALRPQPSLTDRVLKMVPVLGWFGGSMIGNEVPRNDSGQFDWNKASLYWKIVWWFDARFGLFGGEILSADKED